MNIEIKKSIKPIKYSEALNLLEERVDKINKKRADELIWILEHPSTFTSGVNFQEEDIREFLYQDREVDPIEENEAKKQIERINNELDEQQKIMIKMNFFENKSHKKIADELEIPLGTVKSRIRHILTKMQGFLR